MLGLHCFLCHFSLTPSDALDDVFHLNPNHTFSALYILPALWYFFPDHISFFNYSRIWESWCIVSSSFTMLVFSQTISPTFVWFAMQKQIKYKNKHCIKFKMNFRHTWLKLTSYSMQNIGSNHNHTRIYNRLSSTILCSLPTIKPNCVSQKSR